MRRAQCALFDVLAMSSTSREGSTPILSRKAPGGLWNEHVVFRAGINFTIRIALSANCIPPRRRVRRLVEGESWALALCTMVVGVRSHIHYAHTRIRFYLLLVAIWLKFVSIRAVQDSYPRRHKRLLTNLFGSGAVLIPGS